MQLLSLFTGYGGLDMAVRALTGADLVGVSDIADGARAVLAKTHPNTPNLGDITELGTTGLPDFDIVSGGYPCQPFSTAGTRRGTSDPRHLWPHVARIIAARRPRAVVLENVRGHLSLGFNQVLADLAGMGYAARWSIVAASSAGAAHRRERLYVVAWPAGAPYQVAVPDKVDTAGECGPAGYVVRPRVDEPGTRNPLDTQRVFTDKIVLFPTPNTFDHAPARRGSALDHQLMRGRKVGGTRRGTTGNLREDIALATDPLAFAQGTPDPTERQRLIDAVAHAGFAHERWGRYAPAVSRWSLACGMEPPEPTEVVEKGRTRLRPEFAEWLMGLAPGTVTDPELGLTRQQQFTLTGNGVLPHAAYLALDRLGLRGLVV